jgi:hypothetical protein
LQAERQRRDQARTRDALIRTPMPQPLSCSPAKAGAQGSQGTDLLGSGPLLSQGNNLELPPNPCRGERRAFRGGGHAPLGGPRQSSCRRNIVLLHHRPARRLDRRLDLLSAYSSMIATLCNILRLI